MPKSTITGPVFYVYVLFRPWNGSPLYVGKGKGDRWLDHQRRSEAHPNRHLLNAVKKAARLGLEILKIKVADGLSEEDAFAVERAFIAAIGRGKSGPLVNMTDGGEGVSGRRLSDAARLRISRSATGNQRALGIKRRPDTIEKLRLIAAARTDEIRAKMGNGKRGRPLTDEHKAKLRAAKLGKKLKPEHVAKIAKANTGLHRSDAVKENMRRLMGRDPNSGRWIGRVHADNV